MQIQSPPQTLRFSFTSESQRQALFSRLTEGQVLEARVLEPLPDGRWAVRVLGHTLVAESRLTLAPGQEVSARVETLGPPLVLSLTGRARAEEGALNRAFQSLGLPDNALNRAIVRGLMAEGRPVVRDQVLALRTLLSGLPDAAESLDATVARALFLQKQGLPVTPDTLAAYLSHLPAGALGGLLQNLGELLRNLRIRTGEAARANAALPDLSHLTGEALRRLINGLGIDLEGRLAAFLAGGGDDLPEDVRDTLRSALHHLLQTAADPRVQAQARETLRLLDTLQAINLPTEHREALSLQIPFVINRQPATADLRIFYSKDGQLSADNLRFLLSVDLSGLGRVRFDLTVVDNRATCRVDAEDDARAAFLQGVENELRTALENAGYAAAGVRVATRPSGPPPGQPPTIGVDFRV